MRLTSHGTPIPNFKLHENDILGGTEVDFDELGSSAAGPQKMKEPAECKVWKASPEEIAAELARWGIK